ncbi:MAG: CYTH domain-containing protein [Flavobacteriaceae bacterium]
MIEIERKFLVKSDAYKSLASKQYRIVQGFLNSNSERVVRVRIKENKGFLTVKGKSDISGLTRFEWETEISLLDAENLLKICEKGIIDKMCYEVIVEGKTFEIDEFFGDNKGLVIAEIELESTLETFKRPIWLGEEVTGQIKYYNANLIANPYNKWKV